MDSARFLRGLLSASIVLALQSRVEGQVIPKEGGAADLPAYSAPSSCPDAASWIHEILSRLTTDARELGRRELPALVESLKVTPDGKRALLRLRGSGDARVVVGEDCSEVLAGAALIAAIAFGSSLERKEKGSIGWAAPGLVTRLPSPRVHGVRFEVEGGASVPLLLTRSLPGPQAARARAILDRRESFE